MSKRYSKLGPGEGPNYDWENDHTFVKVSGQDSSGAYTLMEDNLKASFALGLHRHDNHAETFYFLDGEVDFFVDGDWHRVHGRHHDACPCGRAPCVPRGRGKTGADADDLSAFGV